MRRPVAAIALVLTLFAVGFAGCSASHHFTAHRTARPGDQHSLTPHQLLAIAISAAARSDEPHPTDVEAVRSTRAAVARTIWPSAKIATDATPVYAITMHGRFTAYRSLGTHRPHGTVLTLVVTATGPSAGKELDANLSHGRHLNLGRVGRVRRLV